MDFTSFDARQTGLSSYGFAVGSAGIGLTCMAIVAGSGNPLVKRTVDDWVSAPTTVMVTPNANGFLCQQGFDVGGGVCLVNRRDNTGGTGRTLNVFRSTDSGATWALAQALLTYNIGADEVKRMSPFARLGNGNLLINMGYNDFAGASIAVSEVFQSVDGGVSWSSIADLVAQGVFDPLSPLTIDGDAFLDMVVLDDGTTVIGTFLNQVWRSANSGVTWTLVATGTLDAAVTSAVLCPLGSGVVLALAMVTPAGTLRVYRTSDSGATWAQVGTIASANWTSNSRGRQNAKKYAANSAFAVLDDTSAASRPTVYFTEDAGATWTKAFQATGTVSGTALIIPSNSHAGFFGNSGFWFDPAAPAQIAVSKSKDGLFLQGQQATYEIVVSNPGIAGSGGDATNVVLTDTLPGNGGLVWETAETTQGTCAIVDNVLTCQLGTIAAGESVTVRVFSTAVTPLEACVAQPNAAAIATADGDLEAEDSGTLFCTDFCPPRMVSTGQAPVGGTVAVDEAATSVTIAGEFTEPYQVRAQASWMTQVSITNPSFGGFTAHFSAAAPAGATLFYVVLQPNPNVCVEA